MRIDDLAVDHRARVLMLEDVAVEQVELLALEVVGASGVVVLTYRPAQS